MVFWVFYILYTQPISIRKSAGAVSMLLNRQGRESMPSTVLESPLHSSTHLPVGLEWTF